MKIRKWFRVWCLMRKYKTESFQSKVGTIMDEYYKHIHVNEYDSADEYADTLRVIVFFRTTKLRVRDIFFRRRLYERWDAIIGSAPKPQNIQLVTETGPVPIHNTRNIPHNALLRLAQLEANRINSPVDIVIEGKLNSRIHPDVIEVRKEHIDEGS